MSDEEPLRARRRRALEEPLDVRPDPEAPVVAAEVRNPSHRTHYQVYFPAFPAVDGAMCTCPDFARRGLGTCKHLEAAALAFGESLEIPPPRAPSKSAVEALWARIERRLGAPPSSDPPTVRARVPGRLLIDPGLP